MLSPSDIRPAVEEVLRSTGNSLASYQILDRLPESLRDQIIAERGMPGAGQGNRYSAASLVTDAVELLLPSMDAPYRVYLEMGDMTFTVAGQTIKLGNNAIAFYKLLSYATTVPPVLVADSHDVPLTNMQTPTQASPPMTISQTQSKAVKKNKVSLFQDSLRGYAHVVHKRDNFTCRYCGLDGKKLFAAWLSLSWDHLLPKGHPDRDKLEFIVTACMFCNTADNRYFDMAAQRNISLDNKTPEELVEQRRPYVNKTRQAYETFWKEHVEQTEVEQTEAEDNKSV